MPGFFDKLSDVWDNVKKGAGALREIDDLAKELSPDAEDGPDDTEEEQEEERGDDAP